MNKRLEKILSIPKSFYVSWRLMGIKKAFKLPIFVRYNVCCESLSGKVKLKSGGGIPPYGDNRFWRSWNI